MKATIKNCVYDTEKANFIAFDNNGFCPFDDRYIEENLFQEAGGKYFLCRYAGCMSPYAKCNGKKMVSRKEIVPITYEYAKRWARHHMRVVDYVRHFGMPTEE